MDFTKIKVFIQSEYKISLKLWSIHGNLEDGVQICQQDYCLILKDETIQAITIDRWRQSCDSQKAQRALLRKTGIPSKYVCDRNYSTWKLRPLFSTRNTIWKRIFEIDNRHGSMEINRVIEKSIGITSSQTTRLSIGAMTKAGINLDAASEDGSSEGNSGETSLTLGFETNWAESRATMTKQQDTFRIGPGEHFWICQKNQLLNYLQGDIIEIAGETLWVNGEC